MSAQIGAELDAAVGGVELDAAVQLGLATKKDLQAMENRLVRNLNAPFFERIVAGFSGVTQNVVPPAPALGFKVYDVPDGMKFILTKFIAWSDSHNPSSGAIYTQATAWGGLFHGIASSSTIADFWPYPEASTSQILPYTKEYGWDTGPEWRQNDNVYFQLVGGPQAANITCLLFGFLASLRSGKVLQGG